MLRCITAQGGYTLFTRSGLKMVPKPRQMLFFGYKLARMAASGNVIPRDYPIVASWLIGVVLQVTWAEKITTGFVKVVKEMLKGEGGDSSKAKKGE